MAIPDDAGLWSGGTRESYFAFARDGESKAALFNNAAPWAPCGRGQTFDLPLDVCVARHAYFCGHDMGWTFYVAPNSDLTPTLDAAYSK